MPCHPDRVRRAYPDSDRDTPEMRCLCGAALNEPHARDCYRGRLEREAADPDPLEPTADDSWGV